MKASRPLCGAWNRRRSGSCSEPIRPLTVRVVVPASMERTIRSIEVDGDCGHTITGVNVVPGLMADTSQRNTSLEYIDNVSWFLGVHR
jgi:hypothetical protein